MEDFWSRAKTFAEEAAKKTQTLTTSSSHRIADLVSETAKKSKELAAEASKKADLLKKQADDQIKSLSDSLSAIAAAAPSPTATADPSPSPQNQNMNQTSFRIEGIEGEFDRICKSLGLSGPEDFSITAAAWEEMKVHSNSGILPKLNIIENEEKIVVLVEEEEETKEIESEMGEECEDSVMTDFAPESEEQREVEKEKEEVGVEKEEEEDNAERLVEIIEDDSFSTNTDPRSNNISPNARIKRTITTGNWQKGELLGRGSFGSVYEGISEDGFFFAVKEVSLLDQGSQGKQSVYQLEQEIALLSQFEHENIVQYYDTEMDESKLYIFLELVTKGSLANLYRRYTLRDSQVSGYTRQILHGLKYLHDRNVVHRDIKCANILVDANGFVKLADFGLAKATKLNDVKSCKGTAFWMAPEVVKGKNKGYGLPADMWSLGCTVLEMLTGQIPYFELECMQALYRIGKGERPPIPDSLSRDAQDFITQCLQVNPDERPSAAQLLNHPFVQIPVSQFSGSSFPNPSEVLLGMRLKETEDKLQGAEKQQQSVKSQKQSVKMKESGKTQLETFTIGQAGDKENLKDSLEPAGIDEISNAAFKQGNTEENGACIRGEIEKTLKSVSKIEESDKGGKHGLEWEENEKLLKEDFELEANQIRMEDAFREREKLEFEIDLNQKKVKALFDGYGEGNRLKEAGDNEQDQRDLNQASEKELNFGILNEAQRKEEEIESSSNQIFDREESVGVSNGNLEQSESMVKDVGRKEKDKGLKKPLDELVGNEEGENTKFAEATDETLEIESGEKIRASEMTSRDTQHSVYRSGNVGECLKKVYDRKNIEAAESVTVQEPANVQKTAKGLHVGQSTEIKENSLNETSATVVKDAERMRREIELEKDRLRKIEEEREREKDRMAVDKATLEAEREKEREKDRMAVDRATFEAHDRAYAETCERAERAAFERAERAAFERATVEARQRALTEARERHQKAGAEARSFADKVTAEVRLLVERVVMERATVEGLEFAMGILVILLIYTICYIICHNFYTIVLYIICYIICYNIINNK